MQRVYWLHYVRIKTNTLCTQQLLKNENNTLAKTKMSLRWNKVKELSERQSQTCALSYLNVRIRLALTKQQKTCCLSLNGLG